MNKKLIISLVMVCVMAIGAGLGTYAWFSGTTASTGGTFTAGTLTIDLDTSSETGSQLEIASIDKIAPGDALQPITLVIENTGNLDMAMFKRFNLTAGTGTPAEAEALSKQILVTSLVVKDWSTPSEGVEVAVPSIWIGDSQWDADDDGLATLYDLTHATRELSGGWFGIGLKEDEKQTITIGLKMRELAGNDVQGLSAKLGVEVIATQVNNDAIDYVMAGKGLDLSVDYTGTYFNTHFGSR